jgi:hypothetical protein
LLLLLHLFGLLKETSSLAGSTPLVQSVGQRGTFRHSMEGVAAAIGQLDALFGVTDSLLNIAEGQVKLAEVAGTGGRVSVVASRDSRFQSSPHRLDRFLKPADGAQLETGHGKQGPNIWVAQSRDRLLPGQVKKAG